MDENIIFVREFERKEGGVFFQETEKNEVPFPEVQFFQLAFAHPFQCSFIAVFKVPVNPSAV